MMAVVFFKNECRFQQCGRSFCSLASLVEHIETVHVDFDPKVVENLEECAPEAVHFSYILRFSSCRQQPKESYNFEAQHSCNHNNTSFETVLSTNHTNTKACKNVPHLSESDSSSSSDCSPVSPMNNFIIPPSIEKHRYSSFPSVYAGYTKSGISVLKCPVRGCKKIYKNVNGIKYHFKNGHKSLKGDPDYTFQRFMANVLPKKPLYHKVNSMSDLMYSFEFRKNIKHLSFDDYNKMFSQSVFRQPFKKH